VDRVTDRLLGSYCREGRAAATSATSRKNTKKAIIDFLRSLGKQRNAVLEAGSLSRNFWIIRKKGPAGDGPGRALHNKTDAIQRLLPKERWN